MPSHQVALIKWSVSALREVRASCVYRMRMLTPTSQGCCEDQSQSPLSTWWSWKSGYFYHHSGKMV